MFRPNKFQKQVMIQLHTTLAIKCLHLFFSIEKPTPAQQDISFKPVPIESVWKAKFFSIKRINLHISEAMMI